MTNSVEARLSGKRIAVAIPCFNEAPAIATVIASYRAALPGAELVVFDNNSTDGTGEIARGLGIRVIDVPEQGKGHAVRAAFDALQDFHFVVLTDGDGTYPAEAVSLLLEPLLVDVADMAVGARRPPPNSGAMSIIRGFGNLIFRVTFRILIGPGTTDLLSGYRAFNQRFRETVKLRSSGFEIETELASEAVARRLRVVEAEISYHARIVGTQSKLRVFRDGLRILRMILFQSLRLRPERPVGAWLVISITLALVIHKGIFVIAGAGVILFLGLMLVHRRS